MGFVTPRQVVRRALLSRTALYQSMEGHGSARRSHVTRLLHVLLLISVINQLASSQFMHHPLPGDPPPALFALHEYVGMASLLFVFAFWLWAMIRHGETRIDQLFPWFCPSSVFAVIRDGVAQFRDILRADPFVETDGAFASAAHGFGLVTLTAMAATGTAFFVTEGSIVAHDAMKLHKLIANLMWAYLLGHAGIAVLHHLLGHDIIKRMFWIRRGITVRTPRWSRSRGRQS